MKRKNGFLLLVFIIITALTTIDVIADLSEGSSFEHIIVEAFIILSAAGASIYLTTGYFHALQSQIQVSDEKVRTLQEENQNFRDQSKVYVKGLSIEIDNQFQNWGFTEAERQIGMLLIKGLSQKEIAEIRQVKEKTVRQQCLAIYKKSGLSGRAELSAFFLEDLLSPASS